jgi:hypothetical protein
MRTNKLKECAMNAAVIMLVRLVEIIITGDY